MPTLARRNVERSLAPRRARYKREVETLLAAALRVMRRQGDATATVADVLEEAKLSTRAFYRHFRSKDELFLAVLEQDSIEAGERMEGRLEAAADPLRKLAAWIDEMLSFGYEPRRARRTKLFVVEAARLRSLFPSEAAAIYDAPEQALVSILAEGRAQGVFPDAEPETDAASILAVTWNVIQARFAGEAPAEMSTARARLLSFGLRALGADLERARQLLDF